MNRSKINGEFEVPRSPIYISILATIIFQFRRATFAQLVHFAFFRDFGFDSMTFTEGPKFTACKQTPSKPKLLYLVTRE